jgi:glycerol uptake operon antiterminator
MTQATLYELLSESPIIAAAKSGEGLEQALAGGGKLIFVLYGDILSIADITAKIKDAGKYAFVHADLLEGLAPRDISVQYLKENSKVDGIISTKAGLIRAAKAEGLLTVHRFFVLDSMALQAMENQRPYEHADIVEVLPGVMPKIIGRIAGLTGKPLVASGLINDKEDVITALGAGAAAISTTNQRVWFM